MTTMKTAIVLASVLLCTTSQLSAAEATIDPATRVARWQEDIDCFAKQFPITQKDFYVLMPRDRFEREVAELKRQAPQFSDREIVFALMRMVASLGVAHTSIAFGSIRETATPHSYPIEVQWFSDGLAVVAAAPEYQQAVGCRVARLGSKTPEQVEAALAPYISTENPAHLHAESPRYMALVELMQHEKIAEPGGSLRLTCAKAGGGELALEILPARFFKSGQKTIKAAEALHIPKTLWRRNPDAFYWYEYLPDSRTLYIQYNKCRNDPNNPFLNFSRDVFAFADTHPVQRLIVDLRFNAGGSGGVLQPLLNGLKSRPALTARGHLYVFISGQTFSSGLMAAMDFRGRFHAILLGGPTGNKPNHYGEQENFVLPNSHLLVHYATKHFRLMPDADPPTLAPDLLVPYSLNDFLTGRDPVLEAALGHKLETETEQAPVAANGTTDYEKEQLQQIADGSQWAPYRLWDAYQRGSHGVKPDPAKADKWLREFVRDLWVVRFEPINQFHPSNCSEFLERINQYSSGGSSGFIRARKQSDKLVGSLLSKDPEELKAALAKVPDLKVIAGEKLTAEQFVEYEQSSQASLQ